AGHGLDASRAVPVASNLLSAEQKAGFVQHLRDDYQRIRTQHAGPALRLLSLEEARANAPSLTYATLATPEITARRHLTSAPIDPAANDAAGVSSISLEEIVPFIDWTP